MRTMIITLAFTLTAAAAGTAAYVVLTIQDHSEATTQVADNSLYDHTPIPLTGYRSY